MLTEALAYHDSGLAVLPAKGDKMTKDQRDAIREGIMRNPMSIPMLSNGEVLAMLDAVDSAEKAMSAAIAEIGVWSRRAGRAEKERDRLLSSVRETPKCETKPPGTPRPVDKLTCPHCSHAQEPPQEEAYFDEDEFPDILCQACGAYFDAVCEVAIAWRTMKREDDDA